MDEPIWSCHSIERVDNAVFIAVFRYFLANSLQCYFNGLVVIYYFMGLSVVGFRHQPQGDSRRRVLWLPQQLEDPSVLLWLFPFSKVTTQWFFSSKLRMSGSIDWLLISSEPLWGWGAKESPSTIQRLQSSWSPAICVKTLLSGSSRIKFQEFLQAVIVSANC